MTIIYSQDFESTVTGSLPGGWTPIVGSGWQVTNTGRIVSGTKSLLSPGIDGSIIAYTGTGVPTATMDMELRYDMGYDGSWCGAMLRGDSTLQNAYLFALQSANFQNAVIYKRISGTFTALSAIETGDNYDYTSGNAKVSLRINVAGNVLKARWWVFGATEPSTWNIIYTLDGSIASGGYFGFYFGRPGGGDHTTTDNIALDDLQAVAATDFTVTPSNRNTTPGVATGDYTVQTSPGGGIPSSTVTVALSVGSASGVFKNDSGNTITSVTLTDATAQTFNYVPAPGASGAITLTLTASGGLTTSHTVTATVPDTATGFSLLPTSVSTAPGVATPTITATLNGTLAFNEIIALSDGSMGGTFTPSSLVFTPANALTPQSFTYTPAGGTAGDTITLTASATAPFSASHTASCSVSTGPVTIPINDPNVFLSPYNWFVSGSSYALSTCNGAYIRMGFTGTSLKLNLDISAYASLYSGSSQWPVVRWSIDNGPFTTQQLDSSSSQLNLASGLTNGTHQMFFCMVATTDGFDRWGSAGVDPKSSVKALSFVVDSGHASVAPSLQGKRALIFGDSITEGVQSTGGGGADTQRNDSQLAYSSILGKSLVSEYGQVGFGGLGWITASAGGSPPGAVPFFTPGNDILSSWDKYSAGRSRLVGGLFSPAPDIITIMLGVNDRAQPSGNVTVSVEAALPAIRAAAPGAWIFVIYEVTAGNMAAAVLAGFQAYQTASPDVKCITLDCGIIDHFNLNDQPTDITVDGLHPDYIGTSWIAGIVMKQIQAAMQGGGSPTTAGYSRARVANE